MEKTSDLRILNLQPLIAPRALKEELPMGAAACDTVVGGRRAVENIIRGEDKRLLVITGPCSIHDTDAGLDYAAKLAELRRALSSHIEIVMRVYFEKPRTRLGWRGLILDPHLDGSYDIQTGLRMARRFLLDVAEMGLPAGSEMLDPIVPQYLDDLVTWASIGARTTESQIHREMASGLSMPVGFKNGTDGSIDVGVNALASSGSPHSFIGIDQEGRTSVLRTAGNPMGHLILRGGRNGPNHDAANLRAARDALEAAGKPPAVMVDCSHGNSRKDPNRQPEVMKAVLATGEPVIGFMLESNLKGGRQDPPHDSGKPPVYGLSITDPCLAWPQTEALLTEVAEIRASRVVTSR